MEFSLSPDSRFGMWPKVSIRGKTRSQGWYRKLLRTVGEPSRPFTSLALPRAAALLRFVDQGPCCAMIWWVDLLIPEGTEDVEELLPKGARRDARIERGGLTVRWGTDDEAVAAYYEI